MKFLKSYWPLLLLVGLVVLFLGDVCFGGKMLLLRDLFNGDLWSRVIAGNAIRAGRFPLWCSLFGGGFPYPANPYMGECYPFTWFFVLPSMETAIRLWWVFHLSVGAISFYLLARHWRLEIAPALFGAVSFIFSTFVMAWLEFAQAISCLVWSPLVLLLVSLILERSSGAASKTPVPLLLWRNCALVAGLAAVIALQILTSGEFFYYTLLFAAVYALCRCAQLKDWRCFGRSLLQFAIAGALGGALALPHLLSALELLPLTDRAGEVDAFTKMDSAHPRHWLSFLLPFLYGRPGYPSAYWAKRIYEFAFGTCYAGVLPLLGLFFGASYFTAKGRRRDFRFLIWFFVAIGAGSLVMAMGDYTPVYGLVHHYLPGFGHFRYPTKFFLFVTYAVAVLGAIGFQAILECRERAERQIQKRVWKGMLILTGVLLAASVVFALSPSMLVGFMGHAGDPTPEQITSVRQDILMALLFSISASVLFGLAIFERVSSRRLQIAIVAVAFVNLWIVSRQVQSTLPGGFYARQPESLIKKLSADPQFRVWTPYNSVAQYLYGEKRPDILEWARETGGVTADWAFHGISLITPVGLGISRYSQLVTAMGTPARLGEAEMKEINDLKQMKGSLPPGQMEQIQRLLLSSKLADMLSIRQSVTGEAFDKVLWQGGSRKLEVVERPNPLPRAFVISQWRAEPDDDIALRTIASDGFDPHREAIVQALPEQPPVNSPDSPVGDPVHSVSGFADNQESVTVTASATQRSLLVLGDNWFPGWSATVDGVPQPVYRANFAFRGVFLEPGRHEVKFTYVPRSFRAGAALGMVSAAVVASLGVLPLIKPAPNLPSTPEPAREPAAPALNNPAKAKGKNAGKRKKR